MADELAELVRSLESHVPDPRRGLPEAVFRFVTRLTPMVNVDLLVQHPERGTLLTWRDDGDHDRGWHVPGGIIRYKETSVDRIRAVARSELRAEVTFDERPLAVHELISPTLATRGHFISLLFRCSLASPLDEARAFDPQRPGADAWAWHRQAPADLIPVHGIYRPWL